MSLTAWIILAIAAAFVLGLLAKIGGARGPGGFNVEEQPRYIDENVLFTVYRPKVLVPRRWHTLLAFAHLPEKRPDANPTDPHPAAEVERQARSILGADVSRQLDTSQQSDAAVPEGGEMLFVPSVEGVEFNPPSQRVRWLKDVHRIDFDLRTTSEYDGRQLRGSLNVSLSGLTLADVPLAFRVDGAYAPASDEERTTVVSANRYRKIFPSYSHRDSDVVEMIEAAVGLLGDQYLRDIRTLRSGEQWNERLKELIEEADLFQLFWSSNSMRSEFVRQEWEHALASGKAIRPTYWEEPMPRDEGLPPEQIASLHFSKLELARLTAQIKNLPAQPPAAGSVVAGGPPLPHSHRIPTALLAAIPAFVMFSLLVFSGSIYFTGSSGVDDVAGLSSSDGSVGPTANTGSNMNSDGAKGGDMLSKETGDSGPVGTAADPNASRRLADSYGDTIGHGEDDADIWMNVRRRLAYVADEPWEFNVDVSGGVVTLRGTIQNRQQKAEIERMVRGVAGVIEVRNRLVLSGRAREP